MGFAARNDLVREPWVFEERRASAGEGGGGGGVGERTERRDNNSLSFAPDPSGASWLPASGFLTSPFHSAGRMKEIAVEQRYMHKL